MISAKIAFGLKSGGHDPAKVVDLSRVEEIDGKKYIECLLIPTPDNQYENDWMIVQSVSAQERKAGHKGNAIGNARAFGEEPRKEMLSFFLELTAVDKKRMFQGGKANYLDLSLWPVNDPKRAEVAYEVKQKTDRADQMRRIRLPVIAEAVWIAKKDATPAGAESEPEAGHAEPQSQSRAGAAPSRPGPFQSGPADEDDIPF